MSFHLFPHCTVTLPPLCRIYWRRWRYKMLLGYILSSVCPRLSIYTILWNFICYAIYEAMRFQRAQALSKQIENNVYAVCRVCDAIQLVPFHFWRMEHDEAVNTLDTAVGGGGVSDTLMSAPASCTWNESLIFGICLDASARRHALMSSPYKNNTYHTTSLKYREHVCVSSANTSLQHRSDGVSAAVVTILTSVGAAYLINIADNIHSYPSVWETMPGCLLNW